MKKDLTDLIPFKVENEISNPADGTVEGVYLFPYREGVNLQVMASEFYGWDRLSIVAIDDRPHRRKKYHQREPSMTEVRHIQRRFFEDSEKVVIYSEPNSDSPYIKLSKAQDWEFPSELEDISGWKSRDQDGRTNAHHKQIEQTDKKEVLENMFGAPE